MPWRRLFKRRRTNAEIAPDEIFLDASNIPAFDTDQFEGRIERPIERKSFVFLGIMFALVLLVYGGRAGMLQIVQGKEYAELSEKNRLAQSYIFADRGTIKDRNGVELAYDSHEAGSEFARRIYATYPGIGTVIGYTRAPAKDATGFYYQDRYIGAEGIERAFDERLRGTNGLKLSETDALGNVVSESTIAAPKHGEAIELSIDVVLTQALYDALAHRAVESGFVSGAAAVMDVQTGELIALTSYPAYEPQVMTDKTDQAKIREYLSDPRMPFLNRATTGLFAPGSIIKPYFAFGALAEGTISPEKQIQSTGQLVVPNPYFPDKPSIFRDWKVHGWVDMRHALSVSSDEYFYAVGGGVPGQQGLGVARLEKYARLFGFGSKTGVNVFPEEEGTVPSEAWKKEVFPDDPDWRLGNTYHTSIGQYGFQVTPLQALRAIAAIANGGTLVVPTIEKNAQGATTNIGLQESHVNIIHDGMRLAVTEGTAKALNVQYVTIAAKTGTAEVGVLKDKVNSWVTGFFPYENPKYAFVLMLERGPRANIFGAPGVMLGVFDDMWRKDSPYIK